MKSIIVALGLLALFEMAIIGRMIDEENRKERERKNREGFPWSWTMERERKVQSAMEMICDKCMFNSACIGDTTREECAMCPVEDAVYILAGRRKDACERR